MLTFNEAVAALAIDGPEVKATGFTEQTAMLLLEAGFLSLHQVSVPLAFHDLT